MKVIVCGGTGFIGLRVIEHLLKRGHSVKSLSIPDVPMGSWFPQEKVENEYKDVFRTSRNDLTEFFRGFDVLVYAIGPDDRITPKVSKDCSAYDFFHERLVKGAAKTIKAARLAGIIRCIICNSYFAYFNRERPELKLAETHPYIRCRVEQADRCISIGRTPAPQMNKESSINYHIPKEMDVIIMELPYIFGTHPVRQPIWKDVIIKRLKKMKPYIFFFRGGSNMITVKHVAEAIVGAVEIGTGQNRYPIGDQNVSWEDWLNILLEELGINRKILFMPAWIGSLFGRYLRWKEKREGKEAGLNYRYLFKNIQSQEFYFDPTESQSELNYTGGELEQTIRKTVRRCLKDREKE